MADFTLPSLADIACHPGFHLALLGASVLVMVAALTRSALRVIKSRIPHSDIYSREHQLALIAQGGHRLTCKSEDRPIFDHVRRETMIRSGVIFLLLALFFMGLLPKLIGCPPARTVGQQSGGSGLLPTLPAPQTGR